MSIYSKGYRVLEIKEFKEQMPFSKTGILWESKMISSSL